MDESPPVLTVAAVEPAAHSGQVPGWQALYRLTDPTGRSPDARLVYDAPPQDHPATQRTSAAKTTSAGSSTNTTPPHEAQPSFRTHKGAGRRGRAASRRAAGGDAYVSDATSHV